MTVTSQPRTCLDFFAGSGLVSLALADFFETVWANDICAKKAQVYIANHGKMFVLGAIENAPGDIARYNLVGEFPCQTYHWQEACMA